MTTETTTGRLGARIRFDDEAATRGAFDYTDPAWQPWSGTWVRVTQDGRGLVPATHHYEVKIGNASGHGTYAINLGRMARYAATGEHGFADHDEGAPVAFLVADAIERQVPRIRREAARSAGDVLHRRLIAARRFAKRIPQQGVIAASAGSWRGADGGAYLYDANGYRTPFTYDARALAVECDDDPLTACECEPGGMVTCETCAHLTGDPRGAGIEDDPGEVYVMCPDCRATITGPNVGPVHVEVVDRIVVELRRLLRRVRVGRPVRRGRRGARLRRGGRRRHRPEEYHESIWTS